MSIDHFPILAKPTSQFALILQPDSTPSMSIITVLGATGSQGGSVCVALQGNPHWKVRAVTRNPASNASKKLLEKVIRPKYRKHAKIFTDEIFI